MIAVLKSLWRRRIGGIALCFLAVPCISETITIPAGKQEVVRQVAINDAQSLRYLALAYFNGTNVPKDLHKAYQLFAQAARMKDAQAQFYLGRCYLEGLGTDSNTISAYMWLNLSALQDSPLQQTAIALKQQAAKALTAEQQQKAEVLVTQLQSIYLHDPSKVTQ